ncbi:hypothetical protein BDA96_07G060100 [Sorghum bicolor]|jgi:hypothetical protein|uniref:Uncharacterized protein n=2 Tax=Sorghum bicolor TaxID=4558 RepID=A0A921U8U3_SORBI|nr:hypothetical protein BDA96_07G060100 [Sorghum bicolor]KXG24546.1 hypothetical protein SORBI_3007G057500 [Sorghum bicolor]
MASSSSLSLPLQLPRSAPSSARLGQGTPGYRPSPSAGGRLPTTTTKGLRFVAATSSYQHEAAGHGDSGIVVATGALHLVAAGDDGDELLRGAAVRVRGGAPRSPKGRPGTPREGSGGAGGKVNAAPPTLLRLPKEGAGGQGGSIH